MLRTCCGVGLAHTLALCRKSVKMKRKERVRGEWRALKSTTDLKSACKQSENDGYEAVRAP